MQHLFLKTMNTKITTLSRKQVEWKMSRDVGQTGQHHLETPQMWLHCWGSFEGVWASASSLGMLFGAIPHSMSSTLTIKALLLNCLSTWFEHTTTYPRAYTAATQVVSLQQFLKAPILVLIKNARNSQILQSSGNHVWQTFIKQNEPEVYAFNFTWLVNQLTPTINAQERTIKVLTPRCVDQLGTHLKKANTWTCMFAWAACFQVMHTFWW